MTRRRRHLTKIILLRSASEPLMWACEVYGGDWRPVVHVFVCVLVFDSIADARQRTRRDDYTQRKKNQHGFALGIDVLFCTALELG